MSSQIWHLMNRWKNAAENHGHPTTILCFGDKKNSWSFYCAKTRLRCATGGMEVWIYRSARLIWQESVVWFKRRGVEISSFKIVLHQLVGWIKWTVYCRWRVYWRCALYSVVFGKAKTEAGNLGPKARYQTEPVQFTGFNNQLNTTWTSLQ